MVWMLAPVTLDTGVTQERMGWPSLWTVQAPHAATPQPNLVPVRLRVSRRTQSKGIWGSTSKLTLLPLTLRFIGAFRCCFEADCLLHADASRCWVFVRFRRFGWCDLYGFFCGSVEQPALRGASSYWGTRNRQPPLGLTAQLLVGGGFLNNIAAGVFIAGCGRLLSMYQVGLPEPRALWLGYLAPELL